MASSIWKDYIVSLGTTDGIQFRIKVGDSVIYTGKSYIRPGETANTIRINDVCADYLQNVVPTLSQAEFTALALPVTFAVEKYTSAWVNVDNVQFINDWSYDYSYNPATMGMAFPIKGEVASKGWLIYTAYNAESVTATLTFKDGTTSSVVIPISRSNDFNDDFNLDFSRSTASAGSGSVALDLSQWSDLASVTIGNTTYKVVDKCCTFALHYINAFGGWDSLLIEGESLEQDTITRYTRESDYDNRSEMNRGTRNYLNEVAKSITLHTGWMTDAESALMHHLINSTDVYLEMVGESRFIPVTISDTALSYKTYRNNGCKLVNYDISISFSNGRIRR